MSIKIDILRTLQKYHGGLIAWQINNLMKYDNFELVRVYLRQMCHRNYVKNMGKEKCDQCGHLTNLYRISEQGRIKLHLYS